MATVKFWREDDSEFSEGDCLIIDGQDRELLPIILDDLDQVGIRLYLSAPLDVGRRDIYLVYLALRDPNLELDLCSVDPGVREFVQMWMEFCRCIRCLDTSGADAAVMDLRSVEIGKYYLWRTRELISVLLRTASLLKSVITTPTPLGEISHHQRRTDWWTHNSAFVGDLKVLQSDLAGSDFGDAELFKRELRAILNSLDKMSRSWSGYDTGEAFGIIGQMMLWSARYWEVQKVPTLAVLLCHRSLDFFITSHACDNGLVYFDGERPRFSSQSRLEKRARKDVGLLSAEGELVKTGCWMRDKERYSFLDKLNKTRNRLVFAHGAFRCSAVEAKWFMDEAEKLVVGLGGISRQAIAGPQTAWETCVKDELIFEFERGFQMNLEAVFTGN